MPLRRIAVILAIVAGVLVLIPYAIAPFYRFIDPVSMPMLWRYATGARVERIDVPLSRISPALRLAVIVAEDGSFCRNPGIDLGEIRAALEQSNDNLDESRGASTITQQTAKNLFLWQGRSFVRKALEIPLALWMTLVLPKRRILEIYLNIAEWGPNGEFGAEAGARCGVRQVGEQSLRLSGGGTCRDPAESGAAQRPHAQCPGAQAGRPLRPARRRFQRPRRLRKRPLAWQPFILL